jgi:mRNA-degrading endonuclease toxin of MazEF toxin-antitoxin module
MDLKRPENKGALIGKIKTLANDIHNFLIALVDYNHHKAALMYYWLRNYLRYIKQEETFDPKYSPQLEPGHIVKVDFGFGIGNEFGGLHYALVLAPSNYKSGIVTVVPLRSFKPEKETITTLHKTNIYLGNELYITLNNVFGRLNAECARDIEALKAEIIEGMTSDDLKKSMQRLEKAQKTLDHYTAVSEEIIRLKEGTVAIVSQIRAVSKIRIQDPKNKYDALYNIKISRKATNQIRTAIKEIYNIK